MIHREPQQGLAARSTADFAAGEIRRTNDSLSIESLGGPQLLRQQLIVLISHLNIRQGVPGWPSSLDSFYY